MLKTAKLAVLVILSILAINQAFAEDKSAAMVNGVSIPQSRVDMIVKNAVAQGQTDSPELRKKIRENLINREVVLQEAKSKGVDKLPEVKEQLDAASQEIVLSSFFQDYVKNHPASDDQLKQEYEKVLPTLGGKEYNVSHILVETESEAKAIIKQLGKKAKFDKLAKEKSKDAGSAEHGGSLGWQVPRNFVPPFANAMLELKKGEYTKEPVKSQFGWHVIKLDDVRDTKAPTFEELKPKLEQVMQQQTVQNLITELRAKAKIE